LCWSTYQEFPLSISADTDYSGRVHVTFLWVFQAEVNQTPLAYLPIPFGHRLGPQAWGWLYKEAAQEYLGNAVYGSVRHPIDDSAADWEMAPEEKLHSEQDVEPNGNLLNIMDSMTF
jgi:hypothetical protein